MNIMKIGMLKSIESCTSLTGIKEFLCVLSMFVGVLGAVCMRGLHIMLWSISEFNENCYREG